MGSALSTARRDLLRLQQILLLREFGIFGLPQIQQVPMVNATTSSLLCASTAFVSGMPRRLGKSFNAPLNQPLPQFEEGRNMSAAEIFAGSILRAKPRESELLSALAPVLEHIDASWARIAEMSTDDAAAISQGYADVEVAVAQLFRGGARKSGR